MRDFYPEDMALRNRIFDAWKRAAELFAFQPYDACVVESLDLLERKAGEEIIEQIYAFSDKSGRRLALRPEMTPSLARMVAARQSALAFPLKWYAIAQCFRYERMTRGRKREHYQWNLDIIGEATVAAEAEVIAAAVCALDLLHIPMSAFRVHYNSRALLADLLSHAGVPRHLHHATFLALDKRGKVSVDEIVAMLQAAGMEAGTVHAVLKVAELKTLDDVTRLLGRDNQALKQLQQLNDLLAVYGLTDCVVFDISVVRGLSYYTGVVFEAFDTAREFRAIFGGGRYDNLLSEIGGRPATGVGLGFGDVVVSEILRKNEASLPSLPVVDLAIGFMQPEQQPLAVAVASAWRRKGKTVDLALSPEKPKPFFARVGKGGCREAVYIGPDDVAAGQLRIKDLASRTERSVTISTLL